MTPASVVVVKIKMVSWNSHINLWYELLRHLEEAFLILIKRKIRPGFIEVLSDYK